MKINALVYDLEIIKAPMNRNEKPIEGIEYCDGWGDHKGMGISVIAAYDYLEDRHRVFLKDNFVEFKSLAATRYTLISFNGIRFDNAVLEANGLWGPEDMGAYDILREMWIADGLSPEFNFKTHGGYKLDTTAEVNLNAGKVGHGAMAPVQWQRGEYGSVIDYCLDDVKLTKQLYDRILEAGGLRSPKDPSRFLQMRKPS